MPERKPAIDTAVAEAYERHMVPGMFLHWAQMLVKLAAPRLGEQVLDVACGTGVGARIAASAVSPTGRVVALDVDPGVIDFARHSEQNAAHPIAWHCASAMAMPFDAGTFDLCLCLQGLQFFPDRAEGFREMRRVLKDSGRLVASIWGPIECNEGHRAVVQALERGGVDASSARRACSFANTEDIRQAAASAGFSDTDLRSVDGVSQFASIQSFLDGMTTGSPSTRHAVALLSEEGRTRFSDDVREMLEPYVVNGVLAYPMRTHVLLARP